MLTQPLSVPVSSVLAYPQRILSVPAYSFTATTHLVSRWRVTLPCKPSRRTLFHSQQYRHSQTTLHLPHFHSHQQLKAFFFPKQRDEGGVDRLIREVDADAIGVGINNSILIPFSRPHSDTHFIQTRTIDTVPSIIEKRKAYRPTRLSYPNTISSSTSHVKREMKKDIPHWEPTHIQRLVGRSEES